MTVSYTRNDFCHVRCAEEIEDEAWGLSRLTLPAPCDMAFLSVYQMNQKFFDQEDMFQDEVTT